jgi:tetratricopeptide (TPR) repeat protein
MNLSLRIKRSQIRVTALKAVSCVFKRAIIAFGLMAPAAPALALTQQEIDWCVGKTATPDLQINGCTAAIHSGTLLGSNLAAAYRDRGVAYAKSSDYAHAIADFDVAIRLNPQSALPHNDRGLTYARTGDFDRAIADYNEAIRLDPKYVLALRNRGFAYYAKHAYDPAIADYDAAIRLDPKDIAAYNDRGAIYQAKGDLDRAIADFDEAIRINATYAPAYGNRGYAYYEKGDYDQAIVDCSEALRLSPNYFLAYINRGLAYGGKGDNDRAIADYDEAIRLNPTTSSSALVAVYHDRGIAYFAKGEFARAISDFSEAIRINPTYLPAYLNRGRVNLYANALPDAVADLTRADALNPKSAYVALWLDIADRRSKLPSRLSETERQIDMSQWPAPVVRLYLGQLTPAAVLTAAEDANTNLRNRRICQANFYIGELALERGASDDAARQFRSVVADCPRTLIEWSAANAELSPAGVNR